jgi:hypothetical protein
MSALSALSPDQDGEQGGGAGTAAKDSIVPIGMAPAAVP